ncbi:cytochrome c biogenesis protein CcsA [Bradymonas sediminis]|uniref:Uncharacterized protein n=1 Tax=Bradymonas sediminis TaxID=1548548 RepID=A0A2Z4FKQ5_9DELT|nr:cytochrome c biogenesis protein CcsA [Bradymonas sediminis]AWV89561.1 hypothetical protein DN745_09525 [Bradymonas sediminis]TDP76705.1 cytochrome c assembly protein [Bradymonas sediminis]
MTSPLNILELALPALYALTFGVYYRQFFGEDAQGDRFFGSFMLKGTLAIHVGYLIYRGITLAHFPIATGAEFMSMLAASIAAIYVLVETRHNNPNTGIFFIGLITLFQLFSSILITDISTYPDRMTHSVFGVHIIVTGLGFAALSLSAIYALMYVMLSRQLKARNLGVIFRRLPPLATLENMSKLATIAGVILLGIGLALGHWFALEQGVSLTTLDPTIIAADLIWLAYFLGLIVVSVRGLSGLRMGYFSLFGYVALVGTIVVILSVSGALHSF